MDERFAAFTRSYEAGDGNPRPFMEGLDDRDRRKFRLMIEKYLEQDTAAGVERPVASGPEVSLLTDRMVDRLGGAGGAMSGEVVKLRNRQGLNRKDVVGKLSEEFEASPEESEKIDDYYHDLEFGNLPARGISDRLLDSLAGMLGTTREALRKAGQALGPSGGPQAGALYARMADDAEQVIYSKALSDSPAPVGESRRADPPDRIDDLFTGG